MITAVLKDQSMTRFRGLTPTAPESPLVGRCRKISAGLCASHGQEIAADGDPQRPSRRGRPARPRDLNFRYRSINATTTKAIAMTLKVIMNMLSFTVYIPSVCTIKPTMIAAVK
jgi:hypothetical protein